MNFRRFVYNNALRNARSYLAYLLSGTFMVILFFSFAVFIYHPWIRSNEAELIEINRTAYRFMLTAEYIIFIFAFLFILYSTSVFLKSRKKEFGLLTILGASRKQLNLQVFLENMFIGTVSIVLGILLGFPSSKLLLQTSSRIAGLPDLPFYWPLQAIGLTAASFAALFLIISLFTLLFIGSKPAFDLLKGDVAPKKEPRVSLGLVVLGAALIVAVIFGLKFLFSMDWSTFIILAVAGISATYLFYSQLSILMLRLLKRNRSFTWRRTRLLWISEMEHKSKENAIVLFLTTIMIAVASISSAFLIASFRDAHDSYRKSPYALIVTELEGISDQHKTIEEDISEINNRLLQAGVVYQSEQFTKLNEWYGDPAIPITVISQSEYELMSAQWQMTSDIELIEDGQAVFFYDKRLLKAYPKSLPLAGENMELTESGISFQLTDRVEAERLRHMYNEALLVVNEASYEAVKRNLEPLGKTEVTQVNYIVPDWTFSKLERGSQEDQIGRELGESEWVMGATSPTRVVRSTGVTYLNSVQEMSMIGFIGVFIALMCSFASASFLYFKLYAELARDARVYNSLSKNGLSIEEMEKSATIQMALLFFLPISVAGAQTLIVLNPVLTLAQMEIIHWPIFITIGVFFILQIFYFGIARYRYLKELRRVMV